MSEAGSTGRTTASEIVTGKGRDLAEAAEGLRSWLTTTLEPAKVVDVRNLRYPFGAGASNETILFEVDIDTNGARTTHPLVLRVSPAPEYQLFLDVGFDAQFELLVTLRERALVRVPNAIWFEADPSWFGRPFFVMEQMPGRVPVTSPNYNTEGWLFDARPAERRILWESAVRELGRIHSVPLDAIGFLDCGVPSQSGFQHALQDAKDHYAWACRGESYPLAERLYEWVFDNVPDTAVDGLSWGDARIGNMMFGDDFEVVGVMDWEQACLGGPWLDLAWWLFRDETESVIRGVPRLDGLGSRDETIALWEDVVGIRVPDLRWYETFAGLRHVALCSAAAGLRIGCRPRQPVPPAGLRSPRLGRAEVTNGRSDRRPK